MLTPECLRGIEERVSLRLSDSADVNALLDERRELLLQLGQAVEILRGVAHKFPRWAAAPIIAEIQDPHGINAFLERQKLSGAAHVIICTGTKGDAAHPAPFIEEVAEKPVDEVLRKEAEALLDPKSPGWDAGAERLLKDLKDRKDADKRIDATAGRGCPQCVPARAPAEWCDSSNRCR